MFEPATGKKLTQHEIIQISKLYSVMKTVVQLARDRKYQVVKPIPETIEEFRTQYVEMVKSVKDGKDEEKMTFRRAEMILPCVKNTSGEKMYIYFNGDAKLTVETLQKIRKHAQEEAVARSLLVLAEKPNNVCLKAIESYSREEHGVKMQMFLEEDLVVNITQHELVPQHTPLEADEAAEMLKAYSLTIEMLPRMLTTDPVSLYFGLEKGRVMKIKRKSESAGEYVTYRQVV